MTADRQKILEIVYSAVDEVWTQAEMGEPLRKSEDLILFGRNGMLDSIGLVHFVAAVEEQVAERFGTEITLVSDRALSRTESPFRTVDRVVDFIAELLGGEASD